MQLKIWKAQENDLEAIQTFKSIDSGTVIDFQKNIGFIIIIGEGLLLIKEV